MLSVESISDHVRIRRKHLRARRSHTAASFKETQAHFVYKLFIYLFGFAEPYFGVRFAAGVFVVGKAGVGSEESALFGQGDGGGRREAFGFILIFSGRADG